MSRINKNKMWMGNPVLRQSVIKIKSPLSETFQADFDGTDVITSYIENGKTVVEKDPSFLLTRAEEYYVYGNVEEISIVTCYSQIVIDFTYANMLKNLSSDGGLNITTLLLPKKGILQTIVLEEENINSLDCSTLNPETITSINVSGNPFLSDETEALSFANSLPTVTTSPTLTMYSSDTQATAVQSIAQSKGWKVTIS